MALTVFNEMIGQVFDSVEVLYYVTLMEEEKDYLRYQFGWPSADETLIFKSKNLIAMFFHVQDYYESVSIKEITGDLLDLVGEPLIEAEVVTEQSESSTYSFYKFATKNGAVKITWFGESNGYYSEEVQVKFIRVNKRKTNSGNVH